MAARKASDEKTPTGGIAGSLFVAPARPALASVLPPSASQPFSPVVEPFILARTPEFLFVFKPAGMNSVPSGKPKSARSASAPVSEPRKEGSPENDQAACREERAGGRAGDLRSLPGDGDDLVSWLSAQLRLQGECWGGTADSGHYTEHAARAPEDVRPVPSGSDTVTEERADDYPLDYATRFRREFGMVSRLDRDTSGLILFARDFRSFVAFLRAQEAGHVTKRYRLYAVKSDAAAAVSPLPGSLPPLAQQQSLTMDSFVASIPGPGAPTEFDIVSKFRPYGKNGARVACVLPGLEGKSHRPLSKEAHSTHFDLRGSVLLPFGKSRERDVVKALELDAAIHSGFRHQIRAQMAWAGFPIVGDTTYGGHAGDRLFLESFSVEIAGDKTLSFCFNMYDI